MLIVIDESVIEMLNDNNRYDKETIDVLEFAALSRIQGKHFLFGSRKTLNFLKDIEELTDRAKSIYNKLYNQLPQLGWVINKFIRRVEIVANSYPASQISCIDKQIIRLPVRCFTDLTTWTEAVLLCEHQTDCKIYQKIAEVYLAKIGLGTLPIRCDPRGGGGSTIVKEYDTIQKQEQRFCISIVDSDKKWPSGGIGDTAKAIRRVDDSGKHMCELLIIDSRDAENLIPTQIYRELENNNNQHTLNFLQKLESSDQYEARKHLDFKNGMSLYSAIYNTENIDYKNFWLKVLQGMSTYCLSIDKQCLECSRCKENHDCNCIIIKGLGNLALESVWEHVLDKQSPHKISQMICTHTQSEWTKIGAIVSAWCCGATPIRA